MHRTLALTAAAVLASSALLAVPASARSTPTPKVLCHGHPATIVGARPHHNHVEGTPGDDVIVVRGEHNVVHGNGGDDIICGGPAEDRLFGGDGNDQLYGRGTRVFFDRSGRVVEGDHLDGGAGDDLLVPGAGSVDDVVAYGDAPQAVRVDLAAGRATGWGSDRITRRLPGLGVLGSPYDDTISGGGGRDTLYGGGGSDRIDGRRGRDLISDLRFTDLEAGDQGTPDVLIGGADRDHLFSNGGGDTVRAGAGDDEIAYASRDVDGTTPVAAAPETVRGNGGDDRIQGSYGPDAAGLAGSTIAGGRGSNTWFVFFDGPDTAPADVAIDAGAGTLVRTQAGATTTVPVTGIRLWQAFFPTGVTIDFRGTPRAEELDSGRGPVHARMRGGNDTVRTQGGADVIDAGAGRDRVYAGSGHDTCLRAEIAERCEVTR